MNPNDVQAKPPDRDLCDDLLVPPSLPTELTPLCEQILRRTLRRIRLRRYVRRAALVMALAACWAGGMFTMRWLTPAPAPVPQLVQAQPTQVEPQPEPTPLSPPAGLALEWQAFDSDKHQADLYRAAGEVYLKDEHDPLSAVRCYGHALDAAPEQAQIISKDDDWLLMAIKDARKKEKRDAKTVD